MERRICAVFLPTLSIDLLQAELRKREHNSAELINQPLALTHTVRGKQLIVRRCDKAKRLGIHIGMNLADAQAVAAELCHFTFDPQLEQRVLKQLALWGYRFSPIVAADSGAEDRSTIGDPRYNGLVFDLTGCERLFNGEQNIIQQLQGGLKHFGFNSQLAIAPTLGSAWALSRYAPQSCCSKRSEIRDAVAELPISALRLPRGTSTALLELNIRLIGELLTIAGTRPRHTLLNRFGAALLKRIDQMLGVESEVISPVEHRKVYRTWHTFTSPISDREMLKEAFAVLLEQLLKQLEAAQKRSWKFCLWLKGVDLPPSTRYITLNLPTLKFKHLNKLLALNLERLPINAPIEEIRLFSEYDEAFQPETISFLPGEESAREIRASFAQLLDKFRQQLGAKQVCRMELHTSHIPEHSHSFVSCDNAVHTWRDSTAIVPPVDRPSVMFSTPERVRALAVVPDTPPFALRWRDQSYRVAHGIGPERIQSEWWNFERRESFCRDYFKIQLELGTWLWVYRVLETNEWYLHGIWA